MEMNVYQLGVKRGGTTRKVVANRSRAARRFLASGGTKSWLDSEATYCKKVGTVNAKKAPALA
jgi:hypothetical protein